MKAKKVKIKPPKFWFYLLPGWWRYKREAERTVNKMLEDRAEDIKKYVSDTFVYGHGELKIKD